MRTHESDQQPILQDRTVQGTLEIAAGFVVANVGEYAQVSTTIGAAICLSGIALFIDGLRRTVTTRSQQQN